MSDAQYAATLVELRRVTLYGGVPPCFEACHVSERPELRLGTRAERLAFEAQMRQAGPAPTRRLDKDRRRNMRASRS